MPAGDNLKKRKIAVLGSRSVGKSSLIVQFVENHFVDAYYPTIETTFSKSVNYKGVEYECEIIDTAGQDEYSILSAKHVIGIHGFILVYSVASRKSFDIARIVHDNITSYCGVSDIPCVFVGSKVDLKQRQVEPSEAEQMAKYLNAAWIETSAKNKLNIPQVFEQCVAEIEKHTPHQAEPEHSRCVTM